MDFGLIAAATFMVCLAGVVSSPLWKRRGDLGAQFVVTGTLLLIFYIVGIASGICTIFNFLFRWVL